MQSQKESNRIKYPDLNIIQLQGNPYVTENSQNSQQQQQSISSIYNPFIPQTVIKHHVIRNYKTWHDIVNEATTWVNTKIHVLRVISISVVYCHSTGSGQITIFYNDSDQQIFKQFIANNVNKKLGAALIQTPETWEKHHDKLNASLSYLAQTGGIISISELEVNRSHGRSLSVIWYRR